MGSITNSSSPEISTPSNTLTALRLACLANGYRPVPTEGKKPARGFDSWLKKCQMASKSDVRIWEVLHPDAKNTGILTGEAVAVDIDVLNGVLVTKIEALARDMLGPTSLRRVGQQPKALLLYRTEAPFRKIQSPALLLTDATKAQIEIMGVGQQVIVSGTHPSTGKPYLWDGPSPANVPLNDLPSVTEAMVRAFLTAAEKILRDAGATPKNVKVPTDSAPQGGRARRTGPQMVRELERLASVLAYIPAEDYEIWWRVAAALRADYGELPEAFALFDQWSATYPPKYDSDDCRTKWDDVATVTDIGLGTIYNLATENGWEKEDDPRPIVTINTLNPIETVHQLEDLLLDRGGVYQRAGDVAVVRAVPVAVQNGKPVASRRISNPGLEWIAEVGNDMARWEKYDAKKECIVSVPIPRSIVETFLARMEWRLPTLTGILSAPTLRPDGTLLLQPGYDTVTGLLFEPEGVEFPEIPENPTEDDARAALKLLVDLLEESPFVSPADRSVALSFLLTTLVRPTLPTAPLHAFSATTAGTGKSWIIDLGALISTGRVAPVMALGKVVEELEKKLTAALIEGAQLLSIDNCDRPLEGDLLCQMMTQQAVKVRILGQSKTVECPVTCVMAANGNNLVIQGDMTRRTLVCTLDAGIERPELRSFAQDGHEMVKADRGRYVAAGLTVLRGFIVAGRPEGARPLGSFKEWSRLVRDALIWLGEADPCQTMEKARADDPVLTRLTTVMEQWRLVFKDTRVTSAEIIAIVSQQGNAANVAGMGIVMQPYKHAELREALLEVAGQSGSINGRRLGAWLSTQKGRIVAGMRLVQDGTKHKVSCWRVEVLSGADVAE